MLLSGRRQSVITMEKKGHLSLSESYWGNYYIITTEPVVIILTNMCKNTFSLKINTEEVLATEGRLYCFVLTSSKPLKGADVTVHFYILSVVTRPRVYGWLPCWLLMFMHEDVAICPSDKR